MGIWTREEPFKDAGVWSLSGINLEKLRCTNTGEYQVQGNNKRFITKENGAVTNNRPVNYHVVLNEAKKEEDDNYDDEEREEEI
jgi:hypothetical protein